jgi:hypothetical protein
MPRPILHSIIDVSFPVSIQMLTAPLNRLQKHKNKSIFKDAISSTEITVGKNEVGSTWWVSIVHMYTYVKIEMDVDQDCVKVWCLYLREETEINHQDPQSG